MSQKLRNQIKKSIIKGMVVVLTGTSTYIAACPVKAATTKIAATQNIQKQIKTTNGSVVAVDKIKKSADGKYYVTLSIQNSKGFPKQTTNVMGSWYISFTVNNNRYGLLPLNPGMESKVDQVTNNRITYTTEAKLVKKLGKGEPQSAHLEPGEMNGQKASLQVGELYLFSEKELLKEDLKSYIKSKPNPQIIPFTSSGMTACNYDYILKDEGNTDATKKYIVQLMQNDEKNKPQNVLQSQGLNAKPCTDQSIILDSIGFVDGKLHIISSAKGYDGLRLSITGQGINSNYPVYIGMYNKQFEYQVYDIKDLNALSQCKIKCIRSELLGTEKSLNIDNQAEFKIKAQ